MQDKTATIAWHYGIDEPLKKEIDRIRITAGSNTEIVRVSKSIAKAQKSLSEARNIIDKSEPPAFYRNLHCRECALREPCLKELKERECISLLGGMTPKAISKYHKKSIFSILQLSHLFPPAQGSAVRYIIIV